MANKCERCGRDLPDQVNAEQAIYLCDDCADPAAPAAPTDQAPEYTFRLLTERRIMRHLWHKVIVWYLRRCAGAFHAYPYGADGRYVVLMTDDGFHSYKEWEDEVERLQARVTKWQDDLITEMDTDQAAPAAPTDQAPEYTFRLPEVTITVRTRGRARALALVGQRGEVLGRGEDYTEPSAVGLAVLAARSAIEQCGRR